MSIMPFNRYGMQLVGDASSAEEALAVLAEESIDLVITDISMPGMNGIDFLRVLKDKYPHVRSVVLTCHQDFDYLQQALRLGALDYMVKTQFDDQSVDALLGRVSTQLRKAALLDERRETQTSDDITKRRLLEKRWMKLLWLVKDKEYDELWFSSLEKFRLSDWEEVFADAYKHWGIVCPTLQKLDRESLLPKFQSIADVKTWVSSYREKAKILLCNTNYSEEVIVSIIRSLDFMSDHEREKLNQSDVCNSINMSISYFSKCFKEIVGISFVNYMQDRNIRTAKHLLKFTNNPIYHVAEQSGFQDEKYFGKIFRMKTGMAPSEYRSKSRMT